VKKWFSGAPDQCDLGESPQSPHDRRDPSPPPAYRRLLTQRRSIGVRDPRGCRLCFSPPTCLPTGNRSISKTAAAPEAPSQTCGSGVDSSALGADASALAQGSSVIRFMARTGAELTVHGCTPCCTLFLRRCRGGNESVCATPSPGWPWGRSFAYPWHISRLPCPHSGQVSGPIRRLLKSFGVG
jgi:hypothetical protein